MGASSSSAAAACASVSTTSGLEQAVKAVELLVQQKLMHPSRDELGLVLFGTRGTCLLLIAIVITGGWHEWEWLVAGGGWWWLVVAVAGGWFAR
jgi:hypothetical protein